MPRPSAKELTERELEVMHVFWGHGDLNASQTRDLLAQSGVDRAYVTVANLVRVLVEKGYLVAINQERPFVYRSARSFDDVSKNLVGDLVERVFQGSREKLLVQLLGRRKRLTKTEREFLESLLEDKR